MACKYLMLAFCVVALSSLESVNGKYRISWITSADTNAGTNHWVGFELFTADGKKTDWMWPSESFRRGAKGSAVMDHSSIGDIAKVNLHIQKYWGQAHQDDWKPYQVVVSDSVTKKTYETFPDKWIDTGGYSKFSVTERQCKDNYRNPSSDCLRGSRLCGLPNLGAGAIGAFNAAKGDFYGCLKICNYCYPPDKESDEPTNNVSGDHEKKNNEEEKEEE